MNTKMVKYGFMAFSSLSTLTITTGLYIPTIYIHEPQNNMNIVLKESTTDMKVKYQVFDLAEPQKYNVCFQLDSTTAIELPKTCFPATATEISLNRIAAGTYKLSTFLEMTTEPYDPVESSMIFTSFSVKTYAEALPTLSIYPANLVVIISSGETADVVVNYQVSSSEIPNEEIEVCVRVASESAFLQSGKSDHDQKSYIASTSDVLSLTGLAEDQRSLTLYNMKQGTFYIFLILRHRASFRIFPRSEISCEVRVSQLSSNLPSLSIPNHHIDAVVGMNGADINIDFAIMGLPAAIQSVQPCLMVANLQLETYLLSFTCLAAAQRSLSLHKLPEGHHTAQLVLASISHPQVVFNETAVAVSIEARRAEEFVPTYDWQPLRAWHTIPSGIETRLGTSISQEIKFIFTFIMHVCHDIVP